MFDYVGFIRELEEKYCSSDKESEIDLDMITEYEEAEKAWTTERDLRGGI